MKILKTIFFISVLILSGCGVSTSQPASETNAVVALKNETVDYMKNAVPSATNALTAQSLILPLVDADWTNTQIGLKRPGTAAGDDTSISGYVTNVLDPEYQVSEDDDFGPTVFSRFQQDLNVLEIIGAQVPFSGGAPVAGTHTITAEVCIEQDQCGEQTFEVTISTLTGNANFDVLIDASALDWKGVFRNNSNAANLVSIEEKSGDDFSYGALFWNKSTGVMSYEYVSTGTVFEAQRLRIGESIAGQRATTIAHIYGSSDSTHRVLIQAPNGGDSPSFSVAFEKTNSTDDIAIKNFCASTTVETAETDHCDGAASNSAPDLLAGLISDMASPATLRNNLFGANDANFADITTDDLGEIATSLN